MVECLTRYRGAAGSSLTGVIALWPWTRYINPSLVQVQPRKTSPYITERLLMGRNESNQRNKLMLWGERKIVKPRLSLAAQQIFGCQNFICWLSMKVDKQDVAGISRFSVWPPMQSIGAAFKAPHVDSRFDHECSNGSLGNLAVSKVPSLLAYIKYGNRRRLWSTDWHIIPLGGWTYMF